VIRPKPCYYMYNRDKSVLYFSSRKLSDYYNLGIHYFTLKSHLKKGTYYLKRYSFSKKFYEKTNIKNLSFSEVDLMLKKNRLLLHRHPKG
jgi:hypothetical protein